MPSLLKIYKVAKLYFQEINLLKKIEFIGRFLLILQKTDITEFV